MVLRRALLLAHSRNVILSAFVGFSIILAVVMPRGIPPPAFNADVFDADGAIEYAAINNGIRVNICDLATMYRGHDIGYDIGSDGSDGKIDCSHFVHKVYGECGLDYPYVKSASFARLGHFRKVVNEPVRHGDIIVFLEDDGNIEDHSGIVTDVSESGEILAIVSAHSCGGLARLEKTHPDFKNAIARNPPSDFQLPENRSVGRETWTIYRWNGDEH